MTNVPRGTEKLLGLQEVGVGREHGGLEGLQRQGWNKSRMKAPKKRGFMLEENRPELDECSKSLGAFVSYCFECFAFGFDFFLECWKTERRGGTEE